MKRFKSITAIALVFSLLMFLLTIVDFLALHDIRQDYISSDVVERFGLTSSQEIPAWTSTPQEWLAVNISLLVRFFFIMFIVFAFIKLLKKRQNFG